MKINSVKTLTLIMITAVTLIVFPATAQTIVKPTFVTNDTTQATPAMSAFDVALNTNQAEQKFVLLINNPLHQKLKIKVSGPDGPFFYDATKALSYRRCINLVDAYDGEYTVCITANTKTWTKTVRLNTTNIQTRSIDIE